MGIEIKISGNNLLPWSAMEDWVNGASSAPTGHTLSGAGASVARESTIVKIGTYSASVTRSGADTILYYPNADFADYQGRKVTFGCWVYATVASRVRISISDGVGASNSSYHTGGSSWEFLTVTHNIDPSATKLWAEMQVNTGNTTGYFDSGVMCLGDTSMTVLTDSMDVGSWRPVSRFKSQVYGVPRREGSQVKNLRIESKTLSIDGMVVGTSVDAKRTSFDAIMKALNSVIKKPDGDIDVKNLYFYDDRYYKCFVDTIDPTEIAAGRVTRLKTRFMIPDPFLYAANKTRVNQALAGTTTFTVTNGGSAIARPVITVTNDSSNITSLIIENLTTGQKLSYTGTLATGNDLVIDSENLTVENNGTGDLANVTNEIGIVLDPGGNEIKVTGIVSGDIDVDWQDRWF